MKWFLPFPLFASEPGAAGGGTVAELELEHDDDTGGGDPGDKEGKSGTGDGKEGADKADDPPSLEDVQRELRDERDKRERAEQNARYWADRAQRTSGSRREPEESTEAARPAASKREEKPEQLLEDLTLKGSAALKDRGYVTQEELDRRIKDAVDQTRREIQTTRADAEFGLQLEREFPDVAEDCARIARGQAPKTELFTRAGEIFQDAVRLDPNLEGSKSALLIAIRQAKAELGSGAASEGRRESREPRAERQAERRTRIERQMPVRGRDRGDDPDDDAGFSEDQQAVMRNLKVKPEDFMKHREVKRGR